MLSPKTFSKYVKLLTTQATLSEREIISLRSAIRKDRVIVPGTGAGRPWLDTHGCKLINLIQDHKPLLTDDHHRKGVEYVLSRSLKKNGELRVGTPFTKESLAIIAASTHHRLVGVSLQGLPIYRAFDAAGRTVTYIGASMEIMKYYAENEQAIEVSHA